MLSTALIHQSVAYGLADKLYDDWEETNIWCPVCGQRRLLGLFMPGGTLWLICKPCLDLPVSHYCSGGSAQLFRGVRGDRAAHFRMLEDHWQRYEHGVAGLMVPCPRCGSPLPHRIGVDPFDNAHFTMTTCERCAWGHWQFKTVWHLLATPEGQRFWREHPRIRRLPEREVEASGVPALVTAFESATGSAKLHGIFVRDTFECIHIHVAPGS